MILVLCCVAAPAAAAAPAVSLDTPANGSTTSDSTPLYSGQARDDLGDAAEVTVRVYAGPGISGAAIQSFPAPRTGTTWAGEGPQLADGVYTAEAEQLDVLGEPGVSQPVTFTIDTAPPPDTTPPDTTALSGPSGPTNDATPEFTFGAPEPASFMCRLYAAGEGASASFTGCASPYEPGPLLDGSYVVEAAAVDGAGNQDGSPATWSFQVDTVAPPTTIAVGPGDSTADTVAFVFSSTDDTARFECRLDAGSWEACNSPQSYAGLTRGGHVFEVRAYDQAGNVDASPARWSWQVTSPGTTTGGTTPTTGGAGLTTIPAVEKQAAALATAIVRIRRAVNRTTLRRLSRTRLLRLRGLEVVTAGTIEFHAIARVRSHGRRRNVRVLLGRRQIPAAGTYSLAARLTKRGRRVVRRRPELAVDLKLGFLDRAGRVLWARSAGVIPR